MELLKIADVLFNKRDVIFKQSRLNLAVACVGFMAMMGGAYYLNTIDRIPKFIMIWVMFWFGLFFLLAFSMLKKSLRASNWLMAYNGERLLIKFRSYLNTHFSDNDIQVVSMSKTEIESVRVVKEVQRTKTMRGGSRTEKIIYMELNLPKLDLSNLKNAISEERKKKVKGLKYGHCPVVISGPDKLRLVWGSSENSIQPGIKKALAIFSKQIRVEEELNLGIIAPDIKELLKCGKEIEATQLAKRKFGYTTAQAKAYIEKLY